MTKEKIFRWSTLLLFTASVLKIVTYDIFSYSTEKRIIILVGVGLALLVVSFLYNRLKTRITDFLKD